ncbi:MAG: hypothetical protein ACK6AD_15050 [Cyanobacteriota bacterium]
MSADSPDALGVGDAIEAEIDGVLLSDLIEQLPLSRGSVFELIKAMGIITTSGKGATGKGRVSWLSSADAVKLREAATAVHRKERKIADFAHGLRRQQTPQTAPAGLPDPSGESADPADVRQLLRRLDAAEKALRTGFPLTTAELAWILGVRPGAAVVTRAGIRASRTGRNVWRLELSADSSDSPDAEV